MIIQEVALARTRRNQRKCRNPVGEQSTPPTSFPANRQQFGTLSLSLSLRLR